LNQKLSKWKGSAVIRQGIGAFIGQSGHNTEHCHWAHQVSFSLEKEVVVSSGNTEVQSRAIFIPANIPHSLHPCSTLTIYIDPNSDLLKSITYDMSFSSIICELPDIVTNQIMTCFQDNDSLENGVQALQSIHTKTSNNKKNARLSTVLVRLEKVLQGECVTRDELAELVNLSSSRFSHWFKEQTGLPLRSYKKWLHLVHGIESVLNGVSIQSAAYNANFSDQAHFSRTFKMAFGISPALALSHITTE